MASSMMSSPAVTTVNRGSMVAPFTGLKSMAGFPVRKTNYDITSIASNTGRVWPPIGKKFETLSYLPPLTREQLLKEDGWIPCLEFELELPMFGCTDSAQVLKEVDEAKNGVLMLKDINYPTVQKQKARNKNTSRKRCSLTNNCNFELKNKRSIQSNPT
ncbi:hypothetical protein JHK82_023554 [Glycine max]|nr:hypothetical protein JHK85_024026 [Glycine max]KAG5138823.1 hypothetical protein JHK82_023554 [Glycine max]